MYNQEACRVKSKSAGRASWKAWMIGLVFVVVAASQTPTAQVVVGADGRQPALYEAGVLLEHKYGVPISYEDVAYAGSDLDVTTFRRPVPRSGPLTLDLSPAVTEPEPRTVALLLQRLLEQHVRNGNPGQFKLIETAAGLDIVPVSARNSVGTSIPYSSPLETRISLPVEERDAGATVSLICQLVSSASGKEIGMGGAEPGPLHWQKVRIGANNEVARDVLARLLVSTYPEGSNGPNDRARGRQDYRTSWQLLEDGAPGAPALLTLRQVTMERLGPNDTIIRTPVKR